CTTAGRTARRSLGIQVRVDEAAAARADRDAEGVDSVVDVDDRAAVALALIDAVDEQLGGAGPAQLDLLRGVHAVADVAPAIAGVAVAVRAQFAGLGTADAGRARAQRGEDRRFARVGGEHPRRRHDDVPVVVGAAGD